MIFKDTEVCLNYFAYRCHRIITTDAVDFLLIGFIIGNFNRVDQRIQPSINDLLFENMAGSIFSKNAEPVARSLSNRAVSVVSVL
jgi:hypothetical protein